MAAALPESHDRWLVRRLLFRRAPGSGLALTVLAVALAIRAVDPGFVEDTRLHGFDAAQRLWPRAEAADPVQIVAIDEQSLAARGQWPWPRTLVAELVRRIAAGRPDVLGIDILFAEPDRLSPHRLAESVPGLPPDVTAALARLPASDALLGAAIGTVPTVLVAEPSRQPVPGHAEPQRVVTPVREQAGDPRPFLYGYGSLIQARPEIARGAVAEGAAVVAPDRDGIVRRLPLVVLAEGRLVPGFAAEVVAVAQQQRSLVVTTGAHGVERIAAGDVVASTDARGRAIVDFAAGGLRYFPATRVLDPAFEPAQFAGRVVLLGVTGLGIVDQQQTPFGLMAGVQLHAQLIDSIRGGSLLRRPPSVLWIELAIVVLAGVATIGLIDYGRPPVAAATALGLVGALIGGEFAVFRLAGWLVDGTYAGATTLVTFAVLLTGHLRAAQTERRRLDAELTRQREASARLAGELDAARAIQMGLLPRRFPAFADRDDIDLFAFIEPAREVGGDLFLFLLVDESRLFFMIGDVSGKGIAAALFMAMTIRLVHDAARRHGLALDRVLGDANNQIADASAEMEREGGELMFVTVFAGILDLVSGEVAFASAGHDAPFLVRPGAAPRRLVTDGGVPLGVVKEFAFPVDRDRIEVGEALLLFTDGVTEAMDAAGMFYGTGRLAAALAATSPDNARHVIEAVTEDLRAFVAGAEPADDIALLALRRTEPAGA